VQALEVCCRRPRHLLRRRRNEVGPAPRKAGFRV
jgi:hypothetical protein